MKEHNGKHDFEVKDWTKIKYEVRCHWGIHVDNRYPDPVIHDYYFESFKETEDFVSDYITNYQEGKIIWVRETGKFLQIETYEVATKVRLRK